MDNVTTFEFEDMFVPCPPQFVFDLPHAKAINFFWILYMQVNKHTYEIGNAKYSLEIVENQNENLLSHSHEMPISLRTRNFGTISFDAIYKM